MDIAVTGASGLIGSTLAAGLRSDGHRVRPIVRELLRLQDHLDQLPDGAERQGVMESYLKLQDVLAEEVAR